METRCRREVAAAAERKRQKRARQKEKKRAAKAEAEAQAAAAPSAVSPLGAPIIGWHLTSFSAKRSVHFEPQVASAGLLIEDARQT